MQGGGALGAYQAGVYQAMLAAGLEPDWVIATSIGAISAALIAGNTPENRIIRLREFWRSMDRGGVSDARSYMPFIGATAANFMIWPKFARVFLAEPACVCGTRHSARHRTCRLLQQG